MRGGDVSSRMTRRFICPVVVDRSAGLLQVPLGDLLSTRGASDEPILIEQNVPPSASSDAGTPRCPPMSITLASMNATGLGRAAAFASRPPRVSARSPPRASPAAASPRAGPRSVAPVTRAAVDATVAYAVAQRNLVFAALVAAECVYQQGNLRGLRGPPGAAQDRASLRLVRRRVRADQTDQTVFARRTRAGRGGVFFSGKYFLDRYDAIVPDDMDWPGRGLPGDGHHLLALRVPRQRRGAAEDPQRLLT